MKSKFSVKGLLKTLITSRTIGRPFGIPLQFHWTFILFFGSMLVTVFFTKGLSELSKIALNYFIVFVSVTVHELAHSLMARHHGFQTEKILLLPIGGAAIIKDFGENFLPRSEFSISAVGPLLSGILGFLSGVLYLIFRLPLLKDISIINIVIFMFNILPVFPMDGGRMLRALLAARAKMLTATKVAIGVGSVFYVGFVVLAFTAKLPMLGIIGALMGLMGFAEISRIKRHKGIDDFNVAIKRAERTVDFYNDMSPKSPYKVYLFAKRLSTDEQIPKRLRCSVMSMIIKHDICGGKDCVNCTDSECDKKMKEILDIIFTDVVNSNVRA